MKWASLSFVAAAMFAFAGCGSEGTMESTDSTSSALAAASAGDAAAPTTTWHFACAPTNYVFDKTSQMTLVDFDGAHKFSFEVGPYQLDDWACHIVRLDLGPNQAVKPTFFGSRTGALNVTGSVALAENVAPVHVRYPAPGKYVATVQAGYGTLTIEPAPAAQ